MENQKNKMKKDNLIEVKGVSKIYNQGELSEVNALHKVDLQVARGEIIAVMGESGSGKTTLLNCISGIDDVTNGEVFINGKSLSSMKDKVRTDFRARNMGFIFQTFNLIPVLTALENVELPMLIIGEKPAEAKKKAKGLLDLVGLGDRMSHRPNELSGGQRQRVTVARALANDPKVIWADEPTGNLDTETAEDIMDLIVGTNEQFGSTIVMVTHSDAIAKFAQRKVVMDSGAIV